jgi:hypothetical protein
MREEDGLILRNDYVPGQAIPISPKQLNYCSYLMRARAELSKHWNEKYLLPYMQRPFDEYLSRLKGKETRVVILYVDMESSTRISSEVDSETNLKIVKIFLMQMAKVIDNFRGYVLKLHGDCVIGVLFSNFMEIVLLEYSLLMRTSQT